MTNGRRQFLAALVAGMTPQIALGQLRLESPSRGKQAPENRPLRVIAADKGISVGAAVSSEQLRSDRSFRELVVNECSLVVPEWEMKWSTVRSNPGGFDFSRMDALVKQASAHGLMVRGHPLIWHGSMPPWAIDEVRTGNARALLENHLLRTVGRYRGAVAAWDVVNEPIRTEDGNRSGFRNTPWFEAMGEAYLENAFRLAAEIDPGARLVLNEYNVEYEGHKAEAFLAAIRRLVERNVPIHAVGLQSHLWATRRPLRVSALKRFCREVVGMGLDIHITELDVRETNFELPLRERDGIVSAVADAYLDAVLSECKPREITFWGLSDRYSWLSNPKYNPENPAGRMNRGLPFDGELVRKPLWYSVARKISEIT